MIYTIIWLTLFTIWTSALVALPLIQLHEMKKRAPEPKPVKEPELTAAHAMA